METVKIPRRVFDLLDREKFEQAEKRLLELRHKNSRDPYINYLLGFIYGHPKSSKHSIQAARRYFSIATATDKPVEDAFVRLARLEQNLKHAVRIAKRGLSHFPNSSDLYELLLERSEPTEKLRIFDEIKAQGAITPHSQMVVAQSLFEQREFTKALELISTIQIEDKAPRDILDLMLAFSNLELNDVPAARSIFTRLIDEDINHTLEYNPYVGIILCELKEGNNEKALEYFAELPVDLDLYPPLGPFRGPLWFDTRQYYLRGLIGIQEASTDMKIQAKARGLRAVLLYQDQSPTNFNTETILDDLRFASQIFPGSKNVHDTLTDIAMRNEDFLEVHNLSIRYANNLSWNELERNGQYLDFSFLNLASEKVFNEIVAQTTAQLTADENKRTIGKTCFEPIVEILYSKKDYKTIAKLADLLGEYYLRDTNVLFKVAYSYSEVRKTDLAKLYYQHYAKKYRLDAAVANNLGILYEKEGDFQKAEEYLQQAVALDKKDATAKRNLTRILNYRSAKAKFLKEPFAIKESVLALAKTKNIEGHITVSQKELSTILSMEGRAATTRIRHLLDKFYILQVGNRYNDKFTPLTREQYEINPEIEAQLISLEKEIESEKDLYTIAGNITGENLASIGYNDILTLGLSKISSHDSRSLLQRDIKEAALSILTKSHKTTLVLCGSIIEALLLEKLRARNITVYKTQTGQNKSVTKMDLNDLLYVARAEQIVDEQLYHLGHALRGFRNLIHPSVEERRKAITVSESNAKIAWGILVKLIMEL